MIDCHCHLTYPGLREIRENVVKEAEKEMKAIITCGYPKDCVDALEMSKKYSGFVYLTLGLHPIDIYKMNDDEIEKYLDFIRKHKNDISAIGEIGLDKHWFKDKKDDERFEKFFIKCLDLSKELGLPVLLHTRKEEEDCFRIIQENDIKNAVFHCYGGNLSLAKKIIDSGYYISIATNVMNSKNSKAIAKKFPINRLLTETDSPFLSPNKNEVNRPINVKLVLNSIAELRKMKFEDVDENTTDSAIKFFGLGKK